MKRKIYQATADPMRGMMLTLLTAGGTTPDTIAGQSGSSRPGGIKTHTGTGAMWHS